MVQHQIHDDAMLRFFASGDEPVEVGEGAILRVDVVVVRDVVAEVDLRRGIDGREPDGVDAQALQIVEARGDAIEVANTVGVRVLKAARIDFVDDRVLPPVIRILLAGVCVLPGTGDRAEENQRNDDTRKAAGPLLSFLLFTPREMALRFGRSAWRRANQPMKLPQERVRGCRAVPPAVLWRA